MLIRGYFLLFLYFFYVSLYFTTVLSCSFLIEENEILGFECQFLGRVVVRQKTNSAEAEHI